MESGQASRSERGRKGCGCHISSLYLPPLQPVRTAHQLVSSTLWSGYGWGTGQVDGSSYGDTLGKGLQAPGGRGGGGGGTDKAAAAGASHQRPQDEEAEDEIRQTHESRSAMDPISLMVQVREKIGEPATDPLGGSSHDGPS